ncbi:thioredoxin-like protein [Abortiporus biennis]|nr:thioredoxin-like protein [Abortiporus biennis]
MFSAFNRRIPQLSIFHNSSSPPSQTALKLLNSALTSPYPPTNPSAPPLEFNLEVIENKPPTKDQLSTILSYLPSAASYPSPSDALLSAHPSVISRPTSTEGIVNAASSNLNALKWPIVVDWDDGKVAIGDIDGVKHILEELRKKRDGESKVEDNRKHKGWFS